MRRLIRESYHIPSHQFSKIKEISHFATTFIVTDNTLAVAVVAKFRQWEDGGKEISVSCRKVHKLLVGSHRETFNAP